VVHDGHRRCVLHGIEFSLLHDGVAYAFIVFHANRFDPGHDRFPFRLEIKDALTGLRLLLVFSA
jgi:hypothetical protein